MSHRCIHAAVQSMQHTYACIFTEQLICSHFIQHIEYSTSSILQCVAEKTTWQLEKRAKRLPPAADEVLQVFHAVDKN
jgi:hypothetical protein